MALNWRKGQIWYEARTVRPAIAHCTHWQPHGGELAQVLHPGHESYFRKEIPIYAKKEEITDYQLSKF